MLWHFQSYLRVSLISLLHNLRRYLAGSVHILKPACLRSFRGRVDVPSFLAHCRELALKVLSVQALHALSAFLVQGLRAQHILGSNTFGNSCVGLHLVTRQFLLALSGSRSIACGGRCARHSSICSSSGSSSTCPSSRQHVVGLRRIKAMLGMHFSGHERIKLS